jgi:hypothetical protein
MGVATVEITQTGRGGRIIYREGQIVIRFDWEFAGSDRVLALVFGSTARAWDENHPAARGRQAEIYDRVGAEIIGQKAPGSVCEIDLEKGLITVMDPGSAR